MHFTEVIRIAQRAWDTTKAQSDPVWNECDPTHRQNFAAAAQAVIDSGHAVSDFEHAVKRLAREAEAKRELIEEVQAEQPTAHSDEMQLEATRRQVAEGAPLPSRFIERGPITGGSLDDGDPTLDDVIDLEPLTVAKLRSLAKERGVKVPKGAKKADLIKALQKGK